MKPLLKNTKTQTGHTHAYASGITNYSSSELVGMYTLIYNTVNDNTSLHKSRIYNYMHHLRCHQNKREYSGLSHYDS